MIHTISFTKMRVFILFIVIISALTFSQLANAQDAPVPILNDVPVDAPTVGESTGAVEPAGMVGAPPLQEIDGLEILSDTCFINLENGDKALFKEFIIDPENRPVSAECQVSNTTDLEILTNPSVTLSSISQPEEEITLVAGDTYIIFPDQTQLVLFAFPENIDGGPFDIQVSLTGNFATKTLSSKDHNQPEAPGNATPEEKNIVFITVITLLALLILLAILVYQRKQKEALSETLPPIEGDNNLEE